MRYDIRPLTISQLDECWRLDQRCFIDGEAYSRETFDYLLTAPESVSYRAVTAGGVMVGFVIGLVEPDHTGHVTTVGVAPEHRRRNLAKRLMGQVEDGFRKRNVRLVRLEVRALNTPHKNSTRTSAIQSLNASQILFKWRGRSVDAEVARMNNDRP